MSVTFPFQKSEASPRLICHSVQRKGDEISTAMVSLPSPSCTLICPEQKSIPARRMKIISKRDVVTHYQGLRQD